ncbi:MAG: hypothetical protein CMK59_06745 [Proteobacteria bacterium]|nr:hypothetical protein [Pseudomonadota bacterium]
MLFVFFFSCTQNDPKYFNSFPEVVITTHQDDTEIRANYLTVFGAQVSDPNNAPLDLLGEWWFNSERVCEWAPPDENGTSLCSFVPPQGSLSIEVRAKDPYEFEVSEIISLEGIPSDAPVVSFLAPLEDDFFYSDRPVPISARFYDVDDPIEDLEVELVSSTTGDVALNGETSSDGLFSDAVFLEAGDQTLTLKVTDTQGFAGTASVDVRVWSPNNSPTCEFTSPEDNVAFSAGSNILFEGVVSDPELPLPFLSVEWISDKDGLLGTSVATPAGDVSLEVPQLSQNLHLITLRVEDELGLQCASERLISISTPPVVEIVQPQNEYLTTLGEPVVFEGNITDAEDVSSLIQFEWSTDLYGVFASGTPDGDGINQTTFALPAGTHQVQLTAWDSVGLSSSATQTIHVNTPPPSPVVVISPQIAGTDDDLVAIATPSFDSDGQPISYTYEWYRNGISYSLPSVAPPNNLFSSLTIKGDLWEVAVTPNDGLIDGATTWASTLIANSPPSVQSVSISPLLPNNRSTLTCSGVVTDPDESVDLIYQWSIGGEVLGTGEELVLSPILANAGDEVRCTATATDSDGAIDQDFVLIQLDNSPPQILDINLIPSHPTTSDQITCAYSLWDVDLDELSTKIVWVNTTTGMILGEESLLMLDPNLVSPGDEISCSIEVEDSSGASETQEALATVSNSPPQVLSLEIENLTHSGGVFVDSLLRCAAVGEDVDGDALTEHFSWINLTQDPSQSIGQQAELQLDGINAAGGDVVGCQYTIDDGSESHFAQVYTPVLNAGPVFVQEAELSSFGLVSSREEITCFAEAIDPDGLPVQYQYLWSNLTQGIVLGVSEDILLHPNFVSPGDVVSCMVTATDFEGESSDSTVQTEVYNSLAQINEASVIVSPLPAFVNDEITVEAVGIDLDNDPVALEFDWFKDGALIQEGGTQLPSGTAHGSTLRIDITPHDGREEGVVYSFEFEISNTPPLQPEIEIFPKDTPPKEEQDDLICSIVTEGEDVDGDPLTYQVEWFRNDFLWSGPVETDVFYGDKVSSMELSQGETWFCEVRADDGSDLSDIVRSAELTVEKNCYVAECDYPAQGMDFIVVGAGIFAQGSPVGEVGRDASDEEQHLVRLTKDFALMTTEVTQFHFIELMGYNPSLYQECGYNCPVESLSWSEAVAFANRVSEEEGEELCYTCTGSGSGIDCQPSDQLDSIYSCSGYRLPTEAEWEYAARAGLQTAFWTGNGGSNISSADVASTSEVVLMDGTDLGQLAWYRGNIGSINSDDYGPRDVALTQPNGWGFFDLNGNVYEWCHDVYQSSPAMNVWIESGLAVDDTAVPIEDTAHPFAIDEAGIVTLISVNPQSDGVGVHTIRGGGFHSLPSRVRSSERKGFSAEVAGFRLAKTIHH